LRLIAVPPVVVVSFNPEIVQYAPGVEQVMHAALVVLIMQFAGVPVFPVIKGGNAPRYDLRITGVVYVPSAT